MTENKTYSKSEFAMVAMKEIIRKGAYSSLGYSVANSAWEIAEAMWIKQGEITLKSPKQVLNG